MCENVFDDAAWDWFDAIYEKSPQCESSSATIVAQFRNPVLGA